MSVSTKTSSKQIKLRIVQSVRKASPEEIKLYEFLEQRFKDTLAGKRNELLSREEFARLARYLKTQIRCLT